MNDTTKIAIRNINDAVKNDSLIIFVGAGISINSGLPSWRELIEELKKDIDFSNEEDYLKIAQYYYDTVGGHKYYEKINSIFEDFTNVPTNKIHDQILRINPVHLITTNYDTLLEKIMNSGVIKYDVISQDSDIPYSKSEHYLIKMHGSLDNKNFVLKEEDYLDYEDNFYMISILIKSLIMNNTVLFIGYSLNDSTFNSIFRLIQKGFGVHARKAYFFNTEPQSDTVVKYYKNKGVDIIYDEIKGNDIGKNINEFLKLISNDSLKIPETSEELWENIRFLNSLYFVELWDITHASNLKKKVIIHPSNTLNLKRNEENHFSVSENRKLTNFLNTKTSIGKFLDYTNNSNEYSFIQNPSLSEAFNFYLQFPNKTDEAKLKFRMIANHSFENKQYWNYLVAEFNIYHIDSIRHDEAKLPKSLAGFKGFDKTIDELILTGNKQTKTLCTYFRDEIQSFKFIYKKVFKFNNFLDTFKSERANYINGGSSTNDNLRSLKYELNSLFNFINLNCIAVFHYKEFTQIIHRYFECLIISLDNSNYVTDVNGPFSGTSSIINEITLEDIQRIITYIDDKKISLLLNEYSLSKLKISSAAKEFIFNEIDSLLIDNNENITYQSMNKIKKYINFLYYVDDVDLNKVLSILDNIPVTNLTNDLIKKMLLMLAKEIDNIADEYYDKLYLVINKHLCKIISGKLFINFNSFLHIYSYILKQMKDTYSVVLDLNLEDKFFLINNKPEKLDEIKEYVTVLVNFYEYFDERLKKITKSILTKYEKKDEKDIDVRFIIKILLSGIYKFKSKKDYILRYELDIINEKEVEGYKIFPNPKEVAISELFNLAQNKYYTLRDVKEALNVNIAKGIFPEVDWVLFNIHDDDTIYNLLKNRTFKEIKEIFAKSKKEEYVLNNWLIKQALDDKVDFKIK